ncbi:hypothetical protein MNBD_GAMMA11-2922 [hydrothermal vent metagenome]|uniref:Nucleotidyltransferase family protein n=1 Tax=hydrothermal vent metagenome TaxID=652676 RepID=A0A3B0X582_9ZZZZ
MLGFNTLVKNQMKSLTPLLKAISSNNKNLDIESANDELIAFSISSGLAPLIKFYSAGFSTRQHSKYETLLNAAELTAKIITHVQIRALDDLLRTGVPLAGEIILLKGISICQNYYPQPQMRIMGDIDLLVSDKDAEQIKNILLDKGYQQISEHSDTFYQSHHHIMPFYNENNNVWFEVHTHLFSGSNPVLDDALFDIENIFKNTVSTGMDKYTDTVKQLCPEFQLIYSCSHWAEELKLNKACLQIIDMIFLIQNNGKGIDWNKTFEWINGTASASHLYLILSYFDKYKLVNLPDNYSRLFKLKHHNMGRLNRYILHKIIHQYISGARSTGSILTVSNLEIVWGTLLGPYASIINIVRLPWNILFPPEETNRYGLSRILSRIKHMFTPACNSTKQPQK